MTHHNSWSDTAWRDFLGLSGGIALVGLTLGTVLPLTALCLDRDGQASSVIGLLLALHALGLVLAMPLTTQSVAIFGARRVITFASLGAAANCALLQYMMHTPLLLAFGLLSLGLMLGLVFNLVETWLNEILPSAQRGRWLAIHCTIFTLFQLCGPLLLKFLPPQHAYQLCALLLLLALPAYKLLSNKKLGHDAQSTSSIAWWQLVAAAPAVVWSTMLFALFDALVLGILPVYGRLNGMSETQALWSVSVILAGDTALEWCVGTLADRFSRWRVHVLCCLILLICAPLMPLAVGNWTWWPLLFLTGGAAGGIYVLSLMACGQRFAGSGLLRITALLGAAWGLASIAGPLLAGILTEANPAWALPGILTIAALILLLALSREFRSESTRHNGEAIMALRAKESLF